MAGKPIDLTSRGKKPASVKMQELTRRATGAPAGRIPPPPNPAAVGVRGEPPLPTGQAVRVVNGAREWAGMSDLEQTTLRRLGLQPGQPVPSNMADIVARYSEELRQAEAWGQREATTDLPLPVDPATPPLRPQVTDFAALAPEMQAKVRRDVEGALANEEAARQREAREAQLSQMSPEVQKAIDGLEDLAPAAGADVPVFDDLAGAPAQAPQPAAQPAPATQPADNDLGATTRTHCQHCGWPLDMEDVAEPSHSEKMAFLASVLGEKSFVRTYDLFGSLVKVTFRTLTVAEADACHRRVFVERDAGSVQSQLDFFERVNRHRLHLQLLSLHSGEFQHDLPEGLSPASAPNASTHWQLPAPESPHDTGLQHIEAYMIEKVLPTETLCRVVSNACSRFNRLVARMEALVDNADFWQATAAPP